MFKQIHHGWPIPPKIWLRVTDILANYRLSGKKWIMSGKPKNGKIADEFNEAEIEYNQMADAIWFAKWTPVQRNEWSLIHKNTE